MVGVNEAFSSSVGLEKIEELSKSILNRSRMEGYMTSIPEINTLTGGIRSGTLTILGGATGMGKSLLSLNFAVDLLNQGIGVCYLDLENGSEETLERVVRIKHNLPSDYFNPDNYFSLLGYLGTLSHFRYYSHEEVYKLKGKGVLAKVLVAMQEGLARNGKVFFIDPLQAMESDSVDNYNEQGSIVKTLKEFAQRHGVAVIINHHIRKSTVTGGNYLTDLEDSEPVKYKIPTLDDYKGSAKISDFATDCWSIVRKISNTNDIEKGMTLFRVLKSRKKGLGDVKLWLDINTLRFYPAKKAYDKSYVSGDDKK